MGQRMKQKKEFIPWAEYELKHPGVSFLSYLVDKAKYDALAKERRRYVRQTARLEKKETQRA